MCKYESSVLFWIIALLEDSIILQFWSKINRLTGLQTDANFFVRNYSSKRSDRTAAVSSHPSAKRLHKTSLTSQNFQ